MAKQCAACYGFMGHSEAAFTSECSHVFHPACASGHATCRSCHASWNQTPTFTPAAYSPYSRLRPQPARMPINPFHLAPSPSTCAVCQSATFTSECRHTFHLDCITGSVCPVCTTRWAYHVSSYPRYRATSPPLHFPPVLAVYDDDEPLEPPAPQKAAPPLEDWDLVQDAAADGGGKLVLDMHCEHAAVARGKPHDNFVVLVHAKAPGATEAAATAAAAADEPRAPLDLVTVLDVSGSMTGSKIKLLKKAMEFVIDQLSPADRLSVVSFSTDARRVMRLTRMSDNGKVMAKGSVQMLQAEGATNILKGLTEAAKVLGGRRHKNAVASVILLSDGQDTYNLGPHASYPYNSGSQAKNYRALLPPSFQGGEGGRPTPIHTFGFGTDNDACAMHSIAEETGGTYSFIENQAVVQDSFAQCIGGLLSVAVQEAWISVDCAHPGVRVQAVKSGRYKSSVEAYGRKASVDVGELYAEEERRFLLQVCIPKAGDADDVTQLMKVTCTYRDTATGQVVSVASQDVAVQRPVEVAKDDQKPNMDVAREKFRVEATEDIAAARAAAERGDHAEAGRILDRRQKALLPELSGDARCEALVQELRELGARVATRHEYEKTGRGCLLSGLSSHNQQRAGSAFVVGTMASPGLGCVGGEHLSGSGGGCRLGSGGGYGACPAQPGAAFGGVGAMPPAFGAAAAYATPAMQRMVGASRMAREQQQQPPKKSKNGTMFPPKNGGN